MKTLPKPFHTIPEFDLYSRIYKRRLVHVLIKEPCRCGSLILFNCLLPKKTAAPLGGQILPGSHSQPPVAPLLRGSLQLTPGTDPRETSQTWALRVKNGPLLETKVGAGSLVQLSGC